MGSPKSTKENEANVKNVFQNARDAIFNSGLYEIIHNLQGKKDFESILECLKPILNALLKSEKEIEMVFQCAIPLIADLLVDKTKSGF